MYHYEEPVIRPPAEADALILQATIGCSHNKCTFCVTYKEKKYREKSINDLKNEIQWFKRKVPNVRKVFIGDGDALAMPTEKLLELIAYLYAQFPSLKRVALYASPGNFIHKSIQELTALKQAGLSLLYIGLESGDDDTLRRIKKGFTAAQIAQLLQKPNEAGLKISATVILGLGGPQNIQRLGQNTARLIDQINPRFASALTLMLPFGEASYRRHWPKEWRLLKPHETLLELRYLVDAIQGNKIIFRSNHASNYLPIEGTFQKGKTRMLAQIDAALNQTEPLRPEFLRGL